MRQPPRITILAISILVCSSALAQEGDAVDKDELAAKLSNPTAAVGSMNLFVDHTKFTGDLAYAAEQSGTTILFQPALPKPLDIGFNLLIRPAIPIIIDQPVFKGFDGFESSGVNLGNISFDIALGKTQENGLLYFFGMVGNAPTATSTELRNQWAFGPELALGVFKKTFIGGALITQQWGVEEVEEGVDRTNVTGGQYFYAIPIGSGQVIGAGPTFSYDWNNEQFTLPIGTGYSKTTAIGKTPFKYGIQFWYYIAQPDLFGPEWMVRIQLTPVIKLPWKAGS